jgi:hypothetical protein
MDGDLLLVDRQGVAWLASGSVSSSSTGSSGSAANRQSYLCRSTETGTCPAFWWRSASASTHGLNTSS